MLKIGDEVPLGPWIPCWNGTAKGATVFALRSWQGMFAGLVGMMGLYAAARWLAGHVEAARPSTFDLIALFVVFSAGQGALTSLLVRLFPGG